MATSICISPDGLEVGPGGELALKLGTSPSACDTTNGPKVFADASGDLRVPSYGGADSIEGIGPANSDTNYPQTGGSLYRALSEATAEYENTTCRVLRALVIMTAESPFMRVTAGNGLRMGFGYKMVTAGSPGSIGTGDLIDNIQLNGAAFLTGAEYFEQAFSNQVIVRSIDIPVAATLRVRFAAQYRTIPFSADAQNAVTIEATRIHIFAAPKEL